MLLSKVKLSAAFQKHSLKVVNYIKQQIKLSKEKKITFAQYMEYALYAENLGYYANNIVNKFGEDGDFITAPMLGELFASSIINQLLDLKFNRIFNDSLNILELGAGNGKLAYQLVKLIENSSNHFLKTNFHNYFILETSKELIKQQQQFLLASDLDTESKNRFVWVNNLLKNFEGIILANEVLDALPVNLFKIYNQQIYEKFVTIDNNGNFKFIDVIAKKDFSHKIMELHIDCNLYINNAYSSEICLLLPDFIKKLATNLNRGAIFFCDYGFLSPEYYHEDRYLGTLMCHYQHIAHHDPFFLPGLQDITSHVDFSLVIENAIKYNLKLERFSSLAQFLMDSNIQQIYTKKYDTLSINNLNENILNTIEQHQLNKEINTLISPNEMGEIFKVVLFTKN